MLEALALCIAKIADGDTFTRCDGVKVRLVAEAGPVDAPDFKYSPRCKPGSNGWCDDVLAARAKSRLGQLIRSDTATMQCKGYDRYRRTLCKVRVNGNDVGDQLVREGLAVIRNDWR